MDEFVKEQTQTATLLINETLSEESFSQRMFRTALLFDEYCTLLLCLFGILGNSLSLVVFSTDSKYKNQSASLYLSALAISDTGYLLSLLAIWLEGVVDGGGIITTSDFSCSMFMYLGQVTCFLSVYLTVAFTIERYLAVRSPLSKGRTFTKSKAKRYVFILSTIALLICSYAGMIAKLIKYSQTPIDPLANASSSLLSQDDVHHLSESENVSILTTVAKIAHDGSQTIWDGLNEGEQSNFSRRLPAYPEGFHLMMNSTQKPELGHDSDYICSVPQKFQKISEIANYCDTIITFIIPFLLITYFNIQIATRVWKLKKERQSIIANPSQNLCGDSNSRRCSSYHNSFVNVNVCPEKLRNVLSSGPFSRSNQVKQGHQRCSHINSRSRYDSPEIHVTKTLLLVSSVFLVLNLPSHLIRCALFIQDVTGTNEGHQIFRALQPWANILFNTNFAVNFLLYCMSGKIFRSSLQNLILRILCRQKHPNHHLHRMGNVTKERFQSPARHPSRLCKTGTALTSTMDCPTSYLSNNEINVGNTTVSEHTSPV